MAAAATEEQQLKSADVHPRTDAAVETRRGKKRRQPVAPEGHPAEKPPPVAEAEPARSAISEEQRRDAQREIQRLVLRLRAEGKSEREIKLAKRELKAQVGPLRQPESKHARRDLAWQEWARSSEAEEQRKSNRAREHELVVIPVLWRGRHDKDEVLRAAEDVKACIAQQGVDVFLDARRHYSPGQKFAHWEHRGVMLRVEVGPEDLSAGVCRVCRCQTPGDYKSVERRKVRLPPAGARKLLLLLKDWGLEKIAVERRKDEPVEGDEVEDEDIAVAASARKLSTGAGNGGQPAGPDDLEGNWAPRDVTAKSSEKRSGRTKKRKLA